MKTYKFNINETSLIYAALNFACSAARNELENSIKLDLQMNCKSIVEHDKAIYATLSRLKDIAREHTELKIEGD